MELTEEQKQEIKDIDCFLKKHGYKHSLEIILPEVFEKPERESINVRIEYDKLGLGFISVAVIEEALIKWFPALQTKSLSVKEIEAGWSDEDIVDVICI